jgi:GrpB-like predicted nucleotidyltransferase (UPF0157 family)
MIEIIPYQARWAEEFSSIAAKIRSAIGDKAVAIHHIGSTSVPNLAAKDVIDIQVTVVDLEVPIEMPLTQIGFEPTQIREDHCPPGMTLSPNDLMKQYYRVKDRRINLHIRKRGTFNQRYPLLFRDYLRANPVARDTYGEIKRQLARYFPENVDAYYDVKDPVCDLVILGAFEWAKANQWEPGPSEV